MAQKNKILIVEDDPNFGTILADYLRMQGFDVSLAANGIDGLEYVIKNPVDLCVLDVMMPGLDGFTLAEKIRNVRSELPFVFLTAKHLKEDIMQGYQAGASDYLTKPFDTEIMLMKIRVLLQRHAEIPLKSASLNIGLFVFNTTKRTLEHNDGKNHIQLSPKAAQLLELLIQNLNQVLHREKALLQIWKESNYFTARSMDVYINKLRRYLALDPRIKITNVHGQGYVLEIANLEAI